MIAMVLWFALLAFGGYLLWRNGRGPDQPTIRADLKALLRLPFNIVEDGKEHRSAASKAERDRALKSDTFTGLDPIDRELAREIAEEVARERNAHSSLSDEQKLDEIMALQELWDLSGQETEKEEKGI